MSLIIPATHVYTSPLNLIIYSSFGIIINGVGVIEASPLTLMLNSVVGNTFSTSYSSVSSGGIHSLGSASIFIDLIDTCTLPVLSSNTPNLIPDSPPVNELGRYNAINGLNSDGQQVLFVVSTYQDQVISLSVDHVKHYVKIPEECLPDYDSDYILPEAGALLGGVKSGGDVTISSGIITVNNDSHNHTIVTVDGLQDILNDKVDKVDGKGLSTNDFTTDEKNKLASIPTVTAEDNGAFLRVVNGVWSVVTLSNAEEVGF